MKVKTILRTYEIPEATGSDYPNSASHDPEQFRKDMVRIAGKAAGICYMPDDYLSNGIQNCELAEKRARGTAKSGHYSTYEHGHVTFLIETSKIMAMVLNNMRLYCTSEKSARYTMMKPETELEAEIYNKWIGIYEKIISAYYSESKSEKEINKLAMENARYMISVYTPTVLEYTVPYNRAVLMCGWLKNMAKEALECPNLKWFYERFSKECIELSDLIMKEIGISDEDVLLTDHKDVQPEFMVFGSSSTEASDEWKSYDIFGDVYSASYRASFAMLAQAQRHRTLQYSCILPYIDEDAVTVYIPSIIMDTPYEKEWKKDAKTLIKNGVMIQGVLLSIKEQGTFKDFVLKCKERMCSRAQLEIMVNTVNTLSRFCSESKNLSKANKKLLETITDGDFLPRCGFKGYTCKEPCSLGLGGLKRII